MPYSLEIHFYYLILSKKHPKINIKDNDISGFSILQPNKPGPTHAPTPKMNEADTRANLIDPLLQAAGWHGMDFIQREYEFTDGRKLIGNKRGQRLKADFLLKNNNVRLAIIEAKAEHLPPTEGLEQVKNYGLKLGVSIVYSTNGHKIYEFGWRYRDGAGGAGAVPGKRKIAGSRTTGGANGGYAPKTGKNAETLTLTPPAIRHNSLASARGFPLPRIFPEIRPGIAPFLVPTI